MDFLPCDKHGSHDTISFNDSIYESAWFIYYMKPHAKSRIVKNFHAIHKCKHFYVGISWNHLSLYDSIHADSYKDSYKWHGWFVSIYGKLLKLWAQVLVFSCSGFPRIIIFSKKKCLKIKKITIISIFNFLCKPCFRGHKVVGHNRL